MHAMKLAHKIARRGFSVLELLIVAAIIMILMALVTGAAIRYMDVQRKQNAQLTVMKVDSALRQQWNAVITQAQSEPISAEALALAGNDTSATQRARVIHVKLRLKQEFPTTFAEVLNPAAGSLAPRQSYVSALNAMGAVVTWSSDAGTPPAIAQSSACLLLALQENRGATFNIDAVLTYRETGTVGGVKYIMDDWKKPIGFWRWPYGNPDLNPTAPNAAAGINDLEDPTGLLSQGGWVTAQGANFAALCHPVAAGSSFVLNPAIASAGRDGIFDLDPVTMARSGTGSYDNLYSYNMRQTGRGD
jgi:type II secretory pathway pseudopilin PulG